MVWIGSARNNESIITGPDQNIVIQYTLANPNRGVSIKKKSVPISEFVRISEVIHLYGEFAVNHSKIYRKLAIQILINPSETLLLYYYYNHY